jgi:type I restriction enzyme R subunit
MPSPSEHKTVQARILHYAQEIGWMYVPRDEAERRRGFSPHPNPLPQGERENTDEARKASLFFGDLIDWLMTAQIRGHALELSELTSFTAKGAR